MRHVASFYFVPTERLLHASPSEPIPSFQELRDKGWLEKRTINLQEAFCGSEDAQSVLFVSHRWDTKAEPDPQGAQRLAILEYLRKHRRLRWVWYDWWCMPQRNRDGTDSRTPEERREFDTMLEDVGCLYLSMRVLILLDLQYLGRFWPQFEAWCSMQTVTPNGLVTSERSEARFDVRFVHSASKELGKALVHMLASKTAAQIHAQLAQPDVEVTNLKDKERILPMVLRMEGELKALLSPQAGGHGSGEEAPWDGASSPASRRWSQLQVLLRSVRHLVTARMQPPSQQKGCIRAVSAKTLAASLEARSERRTLLAETRRCLESERVVLLVVIMTIIYLLFVFSDMAVEEFVFDEVRTPNDRNPRLSPTGSISYPERLDISSTSLQHPSSTSPPNAFTSPPPQDDPRSFELLVAKNVAVACVDMAFCVFFAVEATLRLAVLAVHEEDAWLRFDLVVLLVSIAMDGALLVQYAVEGSASHNNMRHKLVRLMRTARVVRFIRLVHLFYRARGVDARRQNSLESNRVDSARMDEEPEEEEARRRSLSMPLLAAPAEAAPTEFGP